MQRRPSTVHEHHHHSSSSPSSSSGMEARDKGEGQGRAGRRGAKEEGGLPSWGPVAACRILGGDNGRPNRSETGTTRASPSPRPHQG